MLHNILNQFPKGRKLQVLSDRQSARLMGPLMAPADLTVAMKYKLVKTLHVVKRSKGKQAPLEWDDTLFLAA